MLISDRDNKKILLSKKEKIEHNAFTLNEPGYRAPFNTYLTFDYYNLTYIKR